ncbi:MAG: gliding motility-associated C-terminal domain-containing protein [Bacteroidia bacterium]
MKKTFFLLLFSLCLLAFTTKAQINLVPNPSFENYSTCPSSISDIIDATPWESPTLGTPDYFNTCSPDTSPFSANVPSNYQGYQQAHTGNAYVGIFVAVKFPPNTSDFREYLQVKLTDSLKINHNYCVSFFLNLSDSSEYAINNIGIYFSTKQPYRSTYGKLPFNPQIKDINYVTDTINWIEYSESFKADSTYKYITIGNFEDSSITNSSLLFVGTDSLYPSVYYYIDDVSVMECDDTVTTSDTIQIPNVITPNNDGKNDYFYIENLPQNAELTIYNRWGNNVYQSLNYQNNWKADEVNAGTYYYLLTLPNKEVKKGFLEVIK